MNEELGKISHSFTDSSNSNLLGMISVMYEKETGEFYFEVPVYKDSESKEFLCNVVEELDFIVNPDGSVN